MASSAAYTVVAIPHPHNTNDELKVDAIRLKEHRLEALQRDPSSFSSDYAYESKQPFEFWTDRLVNPMARIFVVYTPSVRRMEVGLGEERPRSSWVGSLVLCGPQVIDPDNFMDGMPWKIIRTSSPSHADSMADSSLMYYISGVYVDSRFRRQGIAKKLTFAAIDAIKKEGREVKATQAICMIEYEHTNEGARMLYEQCGWKSVAEDHFVSRDGRSIIGIQMRLDIEL